VAELRLVRRMGPRWVDDDRTVKGDRIGYTIIAKWRPWLYYRVITFRVDGDSPIQRMISSMDTGLLPDSAPKKAGLLYDCGGAL
jgi:hypothetical protein